MKFDRKNNISTVLTSWRNSEDPASGLYSLASDPNSPELFLARNLTTRYWRSGDWNAFNFAFAPEIGSRSRFFNYSYSEDAGVLYFTYRSRDSVPSKITINSLGSLKGLMWLQNSQTWATHFSAPRDGCGSYEMCGAFSIKSDVFAFGILLLEILSGRKNTGFRDSDFLSLLGYAWNLWENERVLELIDSVLEIPTSSSTIALRYIIVGLLCVQENPDDRPTISNVLSMLNNEQGTLASPKKPAFIAGRARSCLQTRTGVKYKMDL